MGLAIRAAALEDYPAVKALYDAIIDVQQYAQYSAEWQKDRYPDETFLKAAIVGGELYVGVHEGAIVAGMVCNHACNDGYWEAKWPTAAAPDEMMVLHLLGVHPSAARKGFGQGMVRAALALAGGMNCKAVRLDVIGGNLAAAWLYEKIGFQRVTTLPLYYEDTGWREFMLYEFALE